MTGTYPAGESYAAFRDAGRFAFHVPVAARTRVTRINGKNRVESVEIQNLDTGARRTVHWTPSSPPGTGSPRTSSPAPPAWTSTPPPEGPRRQPLCTSTPGVFAAGNLLHPVDTADIAALDGRTSAPRSGNGCAPATPPAPASP